MALAPSAVILKQATRPNIPRVTDLKATRSVSIIMCDVCVTLANKYE